MKIARVDDLAVAQRTSPFGVGGTTPQPSFEQLSDVDMVGITDGEVAVWDAASSTWLPGAGGGSASLPWSYAQTDGGLAGDGTTDDTSAFNTWLDTVTSSGANSGWFFFEPGVYLISGNVTLPTGGSPQITLTFQGVSHPPFQATGSLPAPAGYSILKGTATTGNAVIDGGSSANNITVVIRDLLCIGPDNPTITFWKLENTYPGAIEGLMISVVPWTSSPTYPTHSGAYGLTLPTNNHSNGMSLDGVQIGGYYTCIKLGELERGRNIVLGNCVVGMEAPFAYHAGIIESLQITAYTYGLKMTGVRYLDILQFDTERRGSPYATTYDIDDASNQLNGYVRWLEVTAGVGVQHLWTVNGGANVLTQEIGPAWGASGSGTVTSVALTVPAEFSIGGSPITTSGTLAITKANESANTVWAGPTTGSAAQPTFRALVAADMPSGITGTTDHEHIMDILMSGDGSTTAFELPAAPFDAYSVAAYVAGTLTEVTLSGALLTTATFGSAPGAASNNIRFDIVAATA